MCDLGGVGAWWGVAILAAMAMPGVLVALVVWMFLRDRPDDQGDD